MFFGTQCRLAYAYMSLMLQVLPQLLGPIQGCADCSADKTLKQLLSTKCKPYRPIIYA